jgi:C4-dicarboxylate-specific signal transduction histidine kinase
MLRAVFRYVLSFAMVALACAVTHLLNLSAPDRPNSYLFIGVIAVSAWYLGSGPGWLSVVLSALAVNYFFVPNIFELDWSARDIPWLATFVLFAGATNALSLQRRRLEAQLLKARDELERRVRDRTLDLQQTTERLMAETGERARTEAALRETQNDLARAARITTVAELTASIAHEVNQPLAAVVANGEAAINWLRRSPPDCSKAAESITAAILAGERASEVIGRVRNLMTKGTPTSTEVDVNDLISSIIKLVHPSLEKRHMSVECQFEPSLPPIWGDRIQLQQLVLNLINNAADAMANVCDRRRELILRTRRDKEDRITITVEDCGCGLGDIDLKTLFQPWYSTKSDGMGMGLSICRTIAESHGGTIRAESRSPCGATFQVSLPAGLTP